MFDYTSGFIRHYTGYAFTGTECVGMGGTGIFGATVLHQEESIHTIIPDSYDTAH